MQRRSSLEASLHQVEVELESVRVQLEEEAEARLDLERQLVKANGDAATWKSKYDSEAAARQEEVEEIRYVPVHSPPPSLRPSQLTTAHLLTGENFSTLF